VQRLVAGAAPALKRLRIRRRPAFAPYPLRVSVPRPLWRWLPPSISLWAPRGTGVGAATVLLMGSLVFGAVRGDHWAVVADELADVRDALANAAGFRITSIALAGGRHVTREEVLTIAGVTGRTSLLFLDATAARARLLSNPWIADATVLKLYPGRLHIAITERDAFALWQKDGKVAVISEDGTVVEPFVAKPFAKLPLVVGAGAQSQAKAFLDVLSRHPTLRNQMQAAVLVAERRWNLRLRNGVDVRLPATGIEAALETLLRLDREKQLLSRDITAVDLRLPDRVTVRLSDEAAAAREAALKAAAKPKRKGGDA
jgi:cell division protein FtsQ